MASPADSTPPREKSEQLDLNGVKVSRARGRGRGSSTSRTAATNTPGSMRTATDPSANQGPPSNKMPNPDPPWQPGSEEKLSKQSAAIPENPSFQGNVRGFGRGRRSSSSTGSIGVSQPGNGKQVFTEPLESHPGYGRASFINDGRTSFMSSDRGTSPSSTSAAQFELYSTAESLSQDEDSEATTSSSSAPSETELARDGQMVTVNISNLPPEVREDEIETYFEAQGENVDVLSTTLLPEDGKASVTLAGLTKEDLALLKTKKHRIRKRTIHVEVSSTQVEPNELPSDDLTKETPQMDTIVVANLPTTCDEELVSMFFENPQKSGGSPDCVAKCSIVDSGTAHVTFKSPQFAAKVMERKGHIIKGQELQLQYKEDPPSLLEDMYSMIETHKLIVTKLPEGVDDEYLSLFVSKQLEIPDEHFSVQMCVGGTAMVEFGTHYTCEELKEMIQKLQSRPLKRVTVEVQLCKTCDSIRISGVAEHYDEEYMELYFESAKKSGGGKVTHVQLLGSGEANVTFQDPTVIPNVLSKEHKTFGESCAVTKNDPFQAMLEASEHLPESEAAENRAETIMSHPSTASTKSHLQQPQNLVEVTVDPLIANCVDSERNRLQLQKEMKELHVSLEIVSKEGKIKITPSKRSKAGWQKEAKQKTEAYISASFTVKRGMKVHKDGIQELYGYLGNLRGENGTLEHKFSSDGQTLAAAGTPDTVEALQLKVEDIFNKHKQTKVDIKLSPQKFAFFKAVKQPLVMQNFPRVSIKFVDKTSSLKLHGTVHDTNVIKTQVLPELVVHEAIDVPLDNLVVGYYLSSQKGRSQLESLIKQSGGQVAPFFVQHEGVVSSLQLLCNSNDESIGGIIEAVCTSTDVKRLPLPQSFLSLQHTVSQEYDTLCAELQADNQVVIRCTQVDVSIAGIAENVQRSVQILSQFIKEKSSTELSIELDKGEWRLLGTHMHEKWKVVEAQCRSVGVNVEQPTSIEEPCIKLKGDLIQVNTMSQEFTKLRESICKATIPIERPGTCNFLRSKNTRLVFNGLESTNKVTIEVTEPLKEYRGAVGYDDRSKSSSSTRKCVASIKTKQIVVYTGDITEFTADVIVNAANVDLKHIGGVAKAISDKGGSVVQKDSDDHVRRKGRLAAGDAWLTRQVGNLPCKALVHAVGPVWSGGKRKEELLLGRACRESLFAAKSYSSIIFPAISSGIYGFPISKCAETMIKDIVDFCNENAMSELRDIGIILPPSKSAEVAFFIQALQKCLPPEAVHTDTSTSADRDSIVTEAPVGGPHATMHPPHERHTARSTKPRSKKKSTVTSGSVPNCLKLRKGSLLDVKADVYVNTTNNNLDLSQGAVSKALLKAGGRALQTECDQQKPIQTGDIGVTRGGKLPCSYVIHTVVPSYNGGQGQKVLRSSVQKCLEKCSSLGMSSIAFPAIGTGNLGYPNDAVAKTMVNAITDFISANKRTSITAVHLVIFMEDTYQAFQQVLQSPSSGSQTEAESFDHEQTPHDFTVPKPKGRGRRFRSAPLLDDNPLGVSLERQEQTFTVDNLKVQILNGDITDERSNAIVNPTNANLKLEGQGVAGALLRKGGPELQRLCDAVRANGKPLGGEKVFETPSSGSLKCKSLFHVNFEGNDGKSFVKVITNCLKKAEENQYNSISFPAIGTGTHGYPPQEAAVGLMKAVEQLSKTRPRYLKCIRVVLFQPSVFQEFLAAFRNPAQPGFFGRMFYGSTPTWSSAEKSEDPPQHPVSLEGEGGSEVEIKELNVIIYGDNKESISVVEQDVMSLINENFAIEPVDDPNVDKLPSADTQMLREKAKRLQVQIDIDRRLNQIRLKGDRADVHQMKCSVIECFSKFERHASRQREAESRKREVEQLHTIIRWKRMDSSENEFEYDPEMSYEIEMAYKANQATYTYQDPSQSGHFTIDFEKLLETDHTDGDSTASVKRWDVVEQLQQGDRPKTWDNMPVDPSTGKESTLHVVELDPKSGEYKGVSKEFDKTMGAPNPRSPPTVQALLTSVKTSKYYTSIVKIQRIQNPGLYSLYTARKQEVEKRCQNGERHLFHGTSVDTCRKINHWGFNRSFAGQVNAAAYGKGVYFARDASYSARGGYSRPDANGHKHIYLAQVLTGEFTVGNSGMIDAPDNPNHPNTKYDSVVDNVQNPQIFVVFHDAVVYPQYLITFT